MNREVGPWREPRSDRESVSGPSEREKLRRVNPRSGCPEKSGSRRRVSEPSRASKRRRRRVLVGRLEHHARRRIRCRGAEPHESGNGSQGSLRSLRVKLWRGTEVQERNVREETPWTAADAEDLKVGGRDFHDRTTKRDRSSNTAIRPAGNSEGQENFRRGG